MVAIGSVPSCENKVEQGEAGGGKGNDSYAQFGGSIPIFSSQLSGEEGRECSASWTMTRGIGIGVMAIVLSILHILDCC
jgi:hypothetical protein